ncbi:hypothetical protein [Paenibacillus anseongense]|uniref:hypothetical protein n=1 Tax=Paenibacillus anseongense TaxID=2682845 RepID=UPI002DB6F49C|nr:hypothetical protein [Paenibacillus anseongense]MEC0269691.1 hypothetical protein [Paenibacillus anseongense]
MEKVLVDIVNCYGINSLQYEFDFTGNKSTHIIYAPNGVMKSSFANVFDDYSHDKTSSDLIFPNRTSSLRIIDSNGIDLPKESIFVIRPMENNFRSNKISTLLVNDELRKKYSEIHEKIDVEKEKLLKELKKNSGIKNGIENEIISSFNGGDLLVVLEQLSESVLDDTIYPFIKINYRKIFDEKVVAFLETGNFKIQIRKYIEKYNELVSNSPILKKEFNHYHAATVHKILNENGFFKAEHTVNLKMNGIKKEINDEKELLLLISQEKEKIFTDNTLKEIFEEIDKKISTAQLREFREYLFENKEILSELADLDQFRRKIWISYLKSNVLLYQLLMEEFRKGKIEIKKILDKARTEKTAWEEVIEIFNRRFYVPYTLKIKNKEDTVLKDEALSIEYFYKDFEGSAENVSGDLLFKVLSQGEKRTLYLLNIIFEIESRRKLGISTLYIIDDIADSFDYKNKYAIIEYLKEISDSTNFYSIILTHNFDFFRTVQDRIMGNSRYSNSYMAIKKRDKINLVVMKYKYISNPFKEWKDKLNNDSAKLLASITFARNIAEHIGDNDVFNKLTSVLHIKSLTSSITIKDLKEIYKNLFKDLATLSLDNQDKRIIDLVFEVAEEIVQSEEEIALNLENKIVLSIAIRLNSERYMIDKIRDDDFVTRITKNQTAVLYKKYKEKFPADTKSIEILDRVNLMTPENIHLNSFMYEPILDISEFHLKDMYKELVQLIREREFVEHRAEAAAANNENR